jgi:hypothetical protein
MKRDANGPALSAIFVDYDNIYLSLKRKNEEAAKRFSKDAAMWIKELETGSLITATSGFGQAGPRRIVLNRCYGNPVPRRNSHDNSTDMNSFPFIRHHFLRAGAEVVDCPPLTAQLKNSADIRIVMDVRDMITHDTYFDEFMILSSDADFTPLLHRLRAHARRTVIYSNDQTASPYSAISDGEVREADLLRLLLDARGADRAITANTEAATAQLPQPTQQALDMSSLRRDLAAEAANLVRAAGQPVPLEALADRLLRQFGHERTAGSGWAGTGSFRDLLSSYLPDTIKISDQSPFVVFEIAQISAPDHAQLGPVATEQPRLEAAPRIEQPLTAPRQQIQPPQMQPAPAPIQPAPLAQPQAAPVLQQQPIVQQQPTAQQRMPQRQETLRPEPPRSETQRQEPQRAEAVRPEPPRQAPPQKAPLQPQQSAPIAPQPAPAQPRQPSAIAIQQMVARIYEACQAPPLSPPEYRLVFDIMAQEIATRGLMGAPTLDAIAQQGKDHGVNIRRDDVRFILDVVSEPDPWFEHGVSTNLFASRFRNFVVARCRSQGLSLSAEEIDLIDHWFAGAEARPPAQHAAPQQQLPPPSAPAREPIPQQQAPDQWWSSDTNAGQGAGTADDFPRIIRSRIRG